MARLHDDSLWTFGCGQLAADFLLAKFCCGNIPMDSSLWKGYCGQFAADIFAVDTLLQTVFYGKFKEGSLL